VLGKPGEHMAAELLRRLATPAADTAVVGDRLLTDIGLSRSLGMASVLVLSGATSAGELAGAEVRPDYVIEGIGQLLPAGAPDGPEKRPANRSSA
jgi:4-nitrophenyl phosphatase